jgi:hypothetical protein
MESWKLRESFQADAGVVYERDRTGPHTHVSLIRFEMRDSYGETEQGFAE